MAVPAWGTMCEGCGIPGIPAMETLEMPNFHARLFAAVLLLAGLASAQEFRGRIQGVITDATGAIAPGVTVTLRNTGTGIESTRNTNEQGRYVFDYVDPGTYVLTTELAGFKKLVQYNVIVQQRGDVTV